MLLLAYRIPCGTSLRPFTLNFAACPVIGYRNLTLRRDGQRHGEQCQAKPFLSLLRVLLSRCTGAAGRFVQDPAASCIAMAFWSLLKGMWPLFYILLGSRYRLLVLKLECRSCEGILGFLFTPAEGSAGAEAIRIECLRTICRQLHMTSTRAARDSQLS